MSTLMDIWHRRKYNNGFTIGWSKWHRAVMQETSNDFEEPYVNTFRGKLAFPFTDTVALVTGGSSAGGLNISSLNRGGRITISNSHLEFRAIFPPSSQQEVGTRVIINAGANIRKVIQASWGGSASYIPIRLPMSINNRSLMIRAWTNMLFELTDVGDATLRWELISVDKPYAWVGYQGGHAAWQSNTNGSIYMSRQGDGIRIHGWVVNSGGSIAWVEGTDILDFSGDSHVDYFGNNTLHRYITGHYRDASQASGLEWSPMTFRFKNDNRIENTRNFTWDTGDEIKFDTWMQIDVNGTGGTFPNTILEP